MSKLQPGNKGVVMAPCDSNSLANSSMLLVSFFLNSCNKSLWKLTVNRKIRHLTFRCLVPTYPCFLWISPFILTELFSQYDDAFHLVSMQETDRRTKLFQLQKMKENLVSVDEMNQKKCRSFFFLSSFFQPLTIP